MENVGNAVATPDLLQWTEVALGTPLFYDEERRQQLIHGNTREQILEESVRFTIGYAALREVAQQRRRDRHMARAEQTHFDLHSFNGAWDFTETQFELLPEESQQTLQKLGRQAAIVNNLEKGQASHNRLLRNYQQGAIDQLVTHASSRPNMRDFTEDAHDISRGVLLVSPTGTGKSMIEGAVLEYAGIGKPASKRDPHPLKGLLLTTSTALAEQLAGRRGAGTLQMALPDVQPSVRHGKEKDWSGNLHITTTASFKRDVENGLLDPDDFDITLFDEVHHLLEPQLLDLIRKRKLGNLLLGFTATEKYDNLRDVQKVLNYVHNGDSLVSYMRQGILNGAQLFTFRVDLAHDQIKAEVSDAALNAIVREKRDAYIVEAARKLVEEGRRTVVYCEHGVDNEGGVAHARSLAQRLRESALITDESGTERFVRVATVGSVNSQSENNRILREFDAGNIDVLTTVSMLGEGWDSSVNAVIFAANTASPLLKKQQMGRGIRYNEKFPITTYLEFVRVTFGYHHRFYSMWDVFGMDTIDQGFAITEERTKPRLDDLFPDNTAQYNTTEQASEITSKGILSLDDLPESLRILGQSVHKELIGNVSITTPAYENREPIPDGYLAFDYLRTLDTNYVSDWQLATRLRKANIARIGRWKRTQDGQRYLEYHYAPEAVSYIQENPMPPPHQQGEQTFREVGESFGVGEAMIQAIVTHPDNKISCVTRTKRGIAYTYVPGEAIVRIKEIIDRIPMVGDDDVPLKTLHNEVGLSEAQVYKLYAKLGLQPRYMRFINEDTGRFVYGKHLTRAQADVLWAARNAFNVADVDDMTISDISAAAGAAKSVIDSLMTTEQAALAEDKISRTHQNRIYTHYPIEVADDLIERARKASLPPHLVTLKALSGIFATPVHIIRHELLSHGTVNTQSKGLRLQSGPHTTCYRWDVVDHLQAKLGTPATGRLIRSELPHDEHDANIERITRAYTLQKQYGEQRVRLAAKDIIDHATTGTHHSPVEYIKEGGLPRIRPRVQKEGSTHQITHSSRVYTPNHPPLMDVDDIVHFSGVAAHEVHALIAHTHIVGGLPPVTRVNLRGRFAAHYQGKALRTILVSLMGISAEGIAQSRGIPTKAVEQYLATTGAQPGWNGGYNANVWRQVITAFQAPPPGWQPASYFKDVLPDTLAFVRENGGAVNGFYDANGDRVLYISPFSVKLIESQSRNYPTPPSRIFLNRDEIAAIAESDPKIFDQWLHQRSEIKTRTRWYRTRRSDKVLPHYAVDDVQSFIRQERLKNKARQTKSP